MPHTNDRTRSDSVRFHRRLSFSGRCPLESAHWTHSVIDRRPAAAIRFCSATEYANYTICTRSVAIEEN